ncbi:radical SAM protein [Candidatus Bathyarchaeota archaeon]|nr:radical SAM protein [Candidatus Bathyarchaeota archaeon]
MVPQDNISKDDRRVFNLLLVKPQFPSRRTLERASGVTPPLNLLYLAGYLEKVFLKDQDFPLEIHVWDLEVAPLSLDGLRTKLEAIQPDLVGFTAVTMNMPTIELMAPWFKKLAPRSKIVIGGPHPTVVPVQTLESIPAIDYLICGEGERTLEDLIRFLTGGLVDVNVVRGLYFRDPIDGTIQFSGSRALIEDLSILPMPARHLLPYNKYLDHPQSPGIFKKTGNIFTQRGCPFNCSFCSAHVVHEGKVRYFPIENIIEEIKFIKETYGIEHVTFRDSNFTISRGRTVRICRRILEEKLHITWNCETRVSLVDDRLLEIMARAGCTKISFGVESGSPRMLKKINKGISVKVIMGAFKSCRKFGIETQAFFMVGFPSETIEDIQLTWHLIKEITPDYLFISVVVPLPGTAIHETVLEENLFIDQANLFSYQFFHGTPSWRTKNFNVEELIRIQQYLYKKYMFHPRYVLGMLLKVRSLAQVKYYMRAIIGFLEFVVSR